MNWITEEEILDFINSNNYDIRKSHNARWIDQKCTPDVLCIIADCILEFINKNPDREFFSSSDIWHNEYTVQNVESIFKKPNPDEKKAKHEYDKFFQQPMELFSNAKILIKEKRGRRNFYKIANEDILVYISIREMNALKFLNIYNEKVLRDSGIYEQFNNFFLNPNKYTFQKMKESFYKFTDDYTPIKKDYEPGRIFAKIVNPLAFMRNTHGSIKGRMSKGIITKDYLMYNRLNFRNIYVDKPKEITRGEYLKSIENMPKQSLIAYQTTKAKKLLRKFNDAFFDGLSEIDDGDTSLATEMHHIFPVNEFAELSGYIENIIALTPNQHYLKAHPNRNTQIIDKAFQQICLLVKADHIEENIKYAKEVIYTFDNFIYVLSVGLDNKKFEEIADMDFTEVVRLINIAYITSNN